MRAVPGSTTNPRVIPASAQQVVVPYVRIPVTVADGDVTLEFIHTTAATEEASWYAWNLGNVNNDIWRFYSCTVYEQTN